MSCHLSPSGGGLRTVSGRFYGQATLPMLFASHRPHKDQYRPLAKYINYPKNRRNRLWEPAYFKPFGGSAAMAYDEKRYAGLRADPFVWAGADFRMAFWFPQGKMLAFPMQLDVHAAVHPMRYVTAAVTAGFLAKSQGLKVSFDTGCRSGDPGCIARANSTPFAAKDIYLMVHQLPLMGYARIGKFIPTFGLMFADHTSSTRRQFELDHGLLHSRVTGAEIGFAPNYPYFHMAFFRPNRHDQFIEEGTIGASPDILPPFFGVEGFGFSTSFGWRDLGYQIGLSGMVRQRFLRDGGDTLSLALSYGVNPWFFFDWLPLTYLGEIALGTRQRQGSGDRTSQLAVVQELDYLVLNGMNVRVRYDFGDYDTDAANDHYHRLGVGLDWIALPGISLSGIFRVQKTGGTVGSVSQDGLMYIRAWY